jgi:hypothetical protein
VFALIALIYPLEYIYNVIPILPVSMPGASTGEVCLTQGIISIANLNSLVISFAASKDY